MPFLFQQKVLFKHCDPAGIVFYPRYFEMMNDCVETFFFEELKWPFEDLHAKGGVPTASISTDFRLPSKHGDTLTLRLVVTKLGRTSMGLNISALCGTELRFETNSTLVNIDRNGRPIKWPNKIREHIELFMEGQNDR